MFVYPVIMIRVSMPMLNYHHKTTGDIISKVDLYLN